MTTIDTDISNETPPPDSAAEAERAFRQNSQLIYQIGAALHSYGAAAQHLERALTNLAQHLCGGGQFFVTPTAVMCSIRRPDGGFDSRMLRVSPNAIHLGHLCRVDELADRVLEGSVSAGEASARLEAIARQPTRLFGVLGPLATVLASLGFSLMLGGSAPDVYATAIAAILVVICSAWLQTSKNGDEATEFLLALVVSCAVFAAKLGWPGLQVDIVILSGLIALIPGLSLTIAMTELSTKNLLAGTARLMGAVMELLKLSFGVLLGKKLIDLAASPLQEALATLQGTTVWALSRSSAHHEAITLNLALEGAVVVVSLLSFAVLFKSQRRDWLPIAIAGLAAYTAAKFGRVGFGEELGAFIGGLTIGVIGNAFARWIKRPALTLIIPALLPMVPGSIGFRSISMALNLDVIQSMTSAFTMMTTAMALVAGLGLGRLLIDPERSV